MAGSPGGAHHCRDRAWVHLAVATTWAKVLRLWAGIHSPALQSHWPRFCLVLEDPCPWTECCIFRSSSFPATRRSSLTFPSQSIYCFSYHLPHRTFHTVRCRFNHFYCENLTATERCIQCKCSSCETAPSSGKSRPSQPVYPLEPNPLPPP